jgi:hypothetical protein
LLVAYEVVSVAETAREEELLASFVDHVEVVAFGEFVAIADF